MKKYLLAFVLAFVVGGFGFSAYAENGSSNSAQAWTASMGTCMQNAIEARDTAVIAAANTFHTSLTTALTARKDALKSAWAMSDKTARKQAINTAWSTFRTAKHAAKEAHRNSVYSTWTTFRDARIACHAASDGNGSKGDQIM